MIKLLCWRKKKTSKEGGVLSGCTEIGATLQYQSCVWSVFVVFLLPPLTIWFILSFPDGLAAFRTFLKTEFSDENIEFWMACEEYKKIKSSTKLVSKANKIFKEFIDIQAPREVCVWLVLMCSSFYSMSVGKSPIFFFFFYHQYVVIEMLVYFQGLSLHFT